MVTRTNQISHPFPIWKRRKSAENIISLTAIHILIVEARQGKAKETDHARKIIENDQNNAEFRRPIT